MWYRLVGHEKAMEEEDIGSQVCEIAGAIIETLFYGLEIGRSQIQKIFGKDRGMDRKAKFIFEFQHFFKKLFICGIVDLNPELKTLLMYKISCRDDFFPVIGLIKAHCAVFDS
jgi:hypothetical protein